MKSEKFELFMCCLGNGLTICNKAVEYNGEYKYIAHISATGHIKLYVPRNYIPTDAWSSIENIAADYRKKFLDSFNRKNEHERYSILLDKMPLSILLQYVTDKEKSLGEKVAELTEIYMNV